MPDPTISPLAIARAYDRDACWAAGYKGRRLLVTSRAAEAVIAAFPSAHELPYAENVDHTRVLIGQSS